MMPPFFRRRRHLCVETLTRPVGLRDEEQAQAFPSEHVGPMTEVKQVELV